MTPNADSGTPSYSNCPHSLFSFIQNINTRMVHSTTVSLLTKNVDHIVPQVLSALISINFG